jgi:hypothetical protein
MNPYRGVKEILAKPMTKAGYCAYLGWDVPDNEDPEEAGYLVEYTDGGEPNHPGHEGYISWSPTGVFEKAYRPNGTWHDRLQIERDELAARLDKLSAAFRDGDVPLSETQVLGHQHAAMVAYLNILDARIARADTGL